MGSSGFKGLLEQPITAREHDCADCALKLIAVQQQLEFWLEQRLLFQSRHPKFATEVLALLFFTLQAH